MTVVDIETTTSDSTETEEPTFTHIVQRGEYESAGARLMAAILNGTPVTALCGYTWIPYKDPQKYPPCQKCVEIYEFASDVAG